MVKRKVKNVTILLDEDFSDFFDANNWYINGNYIFTLVKLEGKWKKQYLHRLILNSPRNMIVDHVNGNTLDNRKSNLRICNIRQNVINRNVSKSKKSSKYLGVFWNTKNKNWYSRITVNRKQYHLGSFKTEKDAARAYNKAAIKYFKEYARINNL